MRAGTRVSFRPTAPSRALYSYPVPPVGACGTVTPVSFGGFSRTWLRGPGGGLVYVQWDSGPFCGVSRRDVERVSPERDPSQRSKKGRQR
jgi:hypothetical protein